MHALEIKAAKFVVTDRDGDSLTFEFNDSTEEGERGEMYVSARRAIYMDRDDAAGLVDFLTKHFDLD